MRRELNTWLLVGAIALLAADLYRTRTVHAQRLTGPREVYMRHISVGGTPVEGAVVGFSCVPGDAGRAECYIAASR